MRAVSLFVTLFGFWLLLSGELHHTYLLGAGAVCCALVTWLAARMQLIDEEGHPVHRTLAFWRYFPWLFLQIVLSNLDVARRVWSPSCPISPCMVEVPCDTRTVLGTVTYANSITLTPGTVTVEVRPDSMLVHALTREAARSLESGEMLARVRRFEGSGP